MNDAWSTSATNGNFSGFNWTVNSTIGGPPTGMINLAGDSQYFGGTPAMGNLTVDTAGYSFAGLTFTADAAAYNIAGNAFTLGGGITDYSANVQNVSAGIVLGATQTFNVDPAGGSLTLAGTIGDGGSALGLTKAGLGTLTIAGTNSYAGTTVVSGGTLNVAGSLSATSSLSLVNGTFSYAGGGTQSFANTTLRGDASLVVGGTGTLNLGTSGTTFSRNIGGTLLFNQSGGSGMLALSAGATSAVLPWAFTFNAGTPAADTAAGYNFAAYNSVSGSVVPFAGANQTTLSFTNSDATTNFDSVGTVSGGLATSRVANTVRFIGTSVASTQQLGTSGTPTMLYGFNALLNAGSAAANSPNALTFSGASGGFSGLNSPSGEMVLAALGGSLSIGVPIYNSGATITGSGASATVTNGTTPTTVTFTSVAPYNISVSGQSQYSGGSIVSSAEIDVNASTTVAGGVITSGPLGTGPLTINGGSLVARGSSRTVPNPVTVTGDFSLNGLISGITPSSNGLTLSGTVDLGGGVRTISVLSTGNATISGNISDGGLIKAGGTMLTLSGPGNTYALGTTVVAGTLRNGVANALPTTTNLTVTGTGATYDLNGFQQTIGALADGGTTTGTITDTGSTASLNVSSTAAATSTFGGTITGAVTLVKVGGGTLVLTGSNSYTGGTSFPTGGGIIVAQNSYAFGSSGTVSQATSSSTRGNGIQLVGGITIPAGVSFVTSNDGTGAVDYAIDSVSGNNTIQGPVGLTTGGGGSVFESDSGTFMITGNITIAPSQTARGVILTGASSGPNTISGVISDRTANSNTSVTKNTSGGLWILSGANTYTGVTTVLAGTLRAGAASAADGSAGPFGALSAATVANDSSAVLDLNNFNVQVGSLAGGGTTGGTVSLGSGTLTTGGNNTTTSYAGAITGSGGVIKVGTGAFTLAGSNGYSGGTTITNGTLLANGSAASLGIGTTNVIGGFLAGNGSTGAGVVSIGAAGGITAGTGATVTDTPGKLNVPSMNLSGGTYAVKLDGTNSVSDATGTGLSGAAGVANDELLISALTANGAGGTLAISPVFTTNGTGSTGGFILGNQYSFVIADDTANSSAFTSLVNTAITATNGYALSTQSDGVNGQDLLLNFTYTAAPEPSGLLLDGLVAVPLAIGRRRRRQQPAIVC